MSVRELLDCKLVVAERSWPFAVEHAEAIARNWAGARLRNPKMFNGDVFVLDHWSVVDDVLSGVSLPAKFAAYLYWRDAGNLGARYSEAFTTAVVVSRDGGLLLARSVAGTLNEGLFGAPGGLIDARDVGAGGRIDVAGAAARELQEETGLRLSELEHRSGFLLAHIGAYLAIASVFKSALSGDRLLARVHDHLKAQDEPELEAPRVVYDRTELGQLALTPFSHLLARHVLGM